MHSHRLGDFTVDSEAGEIVGPAGREQLDPKVMQVLLVLAQQAGHVVTRQELLEKVWPGVVVGDDVVSREGNRLAARAAGRASRDARCGRRCDRDRE